MATLSPQFKSFLAATWGQLGNELCNAIDEHGNSHMRLSTQLRTFLQSSWGRHGLELANAVDAGGVGQNTIHRIAFSGDASAKQDPLDYFGTLLVPGSSTATIKAAIEANNSLSGVVATVTGTWSTHLDIELGGAFANMLVPLPSCIPTQLGVPSVTMEDLLVNKFWVAYVVVVDGFVEVGTDPLVCYVDFTWNPSDGQLSINGGTPFDVVAGSGGALLTAISNDIPTVDDASIVSTGTHTWRLTLEDTDSGHGANGYQLTTAHGAIVDSDPGGGTPVGAFVITKLNITNDSILITCNNNGSQLSIPYNDTAQNIANNLGNLSLNGLPVADESGAITIAGNTITIYYDPNQFTFLAGDYSPTLVVVPNTGVTGSPVDVTASVVQGG